MEVEKDKRQGMSSDFVEKPVFPSEQMSMQLLDWYDRHARVLPWRMLPGRTADPYKVWLSEIMLQQTTVVTVKPYFEKFLKLWPGVGDLANASLDDVLSAWAGLGYYARARNLHRCAQVVAVEHRGTFPQSEDDLKKLPGIGQYTAAAITAIAFGRRAVVVDGNVERVMARLFAVEEPLPDVKPVLKKLADSLTPDDRAGDYAQAVMDLGATICAPRKANCLICPWSEPCEGRRSGIAETLPRKKPKRAKPTRAGTAFMVLNGKGELLLRDREPKGLLGGMAEVPSTPWIEAAETGMPVLDHAPVEADWRQLNGVVRHTFTHFHLELDVWATKVLAQPSVRPAAKPAQCRWVARQDLDTAALPSVMRKVIVHGLEQM